MNRTENKSKRKKISVVDIVIAVIFLAALVAMIYLMVALLTDESADDADGVQADCLLRIEQVDTERFGITLNEVTGGAECAFLKAGDQVYDPESGEAIGRITAVTYEISTASSGEIDEEGNLVYIEYPGCVDLIITVRTEVASEQDRTVGSLNLRLGSEIDLRTATYEAAATVVGMETGVN